MPEAPDVLCAAPESSASRLLRLGSLALLIGIAAVESAMAVLMYAGGHSPANFAFLLFALSLLVAGVIYLRSRDRRVLLVLQSAAAAALLSLFWAGNSAVTRGPGLRLGATSYDLTLTLAGLLFLAMLLARLLRRNTTEQACNCG